MFMPADLSVCWEENVQNFISSTSFSALIRYWDFITLVVILVTYIFIWKKSYNPGFPIYLCKIRKMILSDYLINICDYIFIAFQFQYLFSIPSLSELKFWLIILMLQIVFTFSIKWVLEFISLLHHSIFKSWTSASIKKEKNLTISMKLFCSHFIFLFTV